MKLFDDKKTQKKQATESSDNRRATKSRLCVKTVREESNHAERVLLCEIDRGQAHTPAAARGQSSTLRSARRQSHKVSHCFLVPPGRFSRRALLLPQG